MIVGLLLIIFSKWWGFISYIYPPHIVSILLVAVMANTSSIDADIACVEAEIARILEEYKKTLTFNQSLLLLNTFKLPNSNYVIECGLCPPRNFSVAIILRKNESEMQFNSLEWGTLIEELQKLYTSFLTTKSIDVNLQPPIFIGDVTTMKPMLQGDVKEVMLMQRLSSLYLSDSDISELLKIDISLVSHRIKLLSNLNFSYYFHNILHSLKEISNNSSMSFAEILNIYCESTNNTLLSNALREYIYFYKEDIF